MKESTIEWVERRGRVTDSKRAEYLGPRIAEYIAIWEALDDEWRPVSDLRERACVERLPVLSANRQVRRVLLALESAGMAEKRWAAWLKFPAFLWRRESS